MDDRYAKQKFFEAVSSLIGAAPLQKRLRYAVLPLAGLRASGGTNQHLSPDLELRLQKLLEKVESPSDDEPYPPLKISDEEARKMAEEMLSIFVAVMGGL
jgi:hypothetical protein